MSQKASKSQAKANNGKKYLEYSELSKEDLVRLLKRVHARIKRLSTSIKELEGEIESLRQLLLYGSGGTNTSGSYQPGGSARTRTGGYTRGKGYSGYKYGRYKRKAPQPEEGGEEPVEVGEEEEEEEEETKPVEKPAEKKPTEAKAETKPEKGGS